MPRLLAAVGILVMAVSGVFVSGLFAADAAPEGTIAQDSVTITVTDGTTSFLPVTGAQLGLLIGAGLLLISLGWYLVSRRKTRELVNH